MRRSPRARFATLALSLVLAASCAKPPPETALDDRRGAVDEVLAPALDRDALTRRLGVAAERCIEASPRSLLCQWRVGNRHAGWRPVARALGTRDQVNVICELPASGGRRAPGSCVAFPRRSNRGLYPLPKSQGTRETGVAAQERAEAKARYASQANLAIDEARNAVSLSHVVGAIPERCVPVDAASRDCIWLAGNTSYGHGTLAASVGAEMRKRMRMTCRLPTDGGARRSRSCVVGVDG